ncbi:MAG: undecaprenyl-diphosphate phosphatase [Promethearchaeota archaeon]
MLDIIILAILQGLFEWFPISSSGQVFNVSLNLFGLNPQESYSLAIWLHLGTALVVLIKFRKEYIKMITSFFPNTFEFVSLDKKKRNWVIIATIGTAITAIPLYFLFEVLITGYLAIHGDLITLIIGGLLIITGVILLKQGKSSGEKSIEKIGNEVLNKDSFISGLMQGISILPGISRSGITISTLLYKNYEKDNALKLSFLMSVPVVFGSIGLKTITGIISEELTILDPLTILIATIISFCVGYLSIEFLLRIAKKIQFGYFCIIYGIISFAVIVPFILIGILA